MEDGKNAVVLVADAVIADEQERIFMCAARTNLSRINGPFPVARWSLGKRWNRR